MPLVDVTVRTAVSTSVRASQLEGMFDVPHAPQQELTWHFDAPLDERPWQVGLILGPSGAGKSTVLRHLFGEERTLTWDSMSVVDSFDRSLSMNDVSAACQAVGFNTIPAWLRPHAVLSNGERFRASMARLLAESKPGETIVVDEFTSVVDRQVAQIGAHAVAKHVRRHPDMRFVAASCHVDIVDWLQPDWIIEPAERTFRWRSVQPRPQLDVVVSPVHHSAWQLFAPFHYLTADLHRGARCFALFVDDAPAAFCGVMRRPHPKVSDIMGVSRLVTLPDWQGLGLAFALVDTVGAAYKAVGERLHTYPAHPALIHGFDRSKVWALRQRPGYGGRPGGYEASPERPSRATQAARAARAGVQGTTTTNTAMRHDRVLAGGNSGGITHGPNAQLVKSWRHGSRPCAVFSYEGDGMPLHEARNLLAPYLKA